ncbi:MAG: glycosyltransferase family 2 protein [Ferruginibacter sp.]
MDDSPLVSIGIPNYNYANYILIALNSVVTQTYKNIELIIIDDLSTDNSIAVIENWISAYNGEMQIHFIKNRQNLGLTKVCNLVLDKCQGKYFQILDADDMLLPEKIAMQVDLLEHENNVAFIYSNISVIDKEGAIIHPDYLGRIGYDKTKMPGGNIYAQLFDFNFIPLPSVLINTQYAKQAGGFDENLQVQDYYLWLKLSEQYNTVYMPGITAAYRVHESSMSNSSLTNPKSVDSVLNIKYRYYKRSDAAIRKKIRKDIYFSTAYLYEFNYPSAKHWLKINFLLNPSVKTLGYFVAKTVGVPFSFFKKLKLKFGTR